MEIAFGQGRQRSITPRCCRFRPSGAALAADIKVIWDSGGAFPGKPGAPAGSEPPGLFPASCVADIQRYHATLDNGQLTVERGSGSAADPDQYFKDESEKYIAFFEQDRAFAATRPSLRTCSAMLSVTLIRISS